MYVLNIVIMCSALHGGLGLSVLLFFLSHHVLCSLPISKELLRLFIETLWENDPPVRLHIHRKTKHRKCNCIHMRYAGFEPAIPIHSVNIFSVFYSHNTTAACHNSSATTLQPAAHKYTAVPPASKPWILLSTR